MIQQGSTASIGMNLYTDKFCQAGSLSTTRSFSFDTAVGAGPTCSEIFTAFGVTSLLKITCLTDKTAMDLAQQYNLFGLTAGGSYYYNYNYTAFQISSCTETPTAISFQRSDDNFGVTEARDCYFLAGATNDTTTVPGLAEMENLQLTLQYSIVLSELSQTEYQLTAGGGLTTYGSSFGFWGLNTTTSLLQTKFTNAGGTFLSWTFDPTQPLTAPLKFDWISGDSKYIAHVLSITMPTTASHTLVVSLSRDLEVFVAPSFTPLPGSCSLDYEVKLMSGSAGRNWGTFFNVEYEDAVSGIIERSSISQGRGWQAIDPSICSLEFDILYGGCQDKCTQGLKTTSVNECNPFVNCNTLPLITQAVSTHTASGCLCGDMLNSKLRLYKIATYDSKVVTAQFRSNNCWGNYTVTSGNTLGVQASLDEAFISQWSMGAIIGVVIAFLVMAALVVVLGMCLQEQTAALAKMLMRRFTTPLRGVQLTVLGLACVLCIAGTWSADMIVFDKTGNFGGQEETMGLFLGVFFPGANSQGPEVFPCMFYIEDSNGDGIYNFDHVASCNAARGGAVMAVFSTFGAAVFMFHFYGNLAIVFEVISLVSTIITVGSLGGLEANFYTPKKGGLLMRRGTGAIFFPAAFFFLVCLILMWVIDKMSAEDMSTDLFKGGSKSSSSPNKYQSGTKEEKRTNKRPPADLPLAIHTNPIYVNGSINSES